MEVYNFRPKSYLQILPSSTSNIKTTDKAYSILIFFIESRFYLLNFFSYICFISTLGFPGRYPSISATLVWSCHLFIGLDYKNLFCSVQHSSQMTSYSVSCPFQTLFRVIFASNMVVNIYRSALSLFSFSSFLHIFSRRFAF